MEKLKILVMTMLPFLAGACRFNGGQLTPDPGPPEPAPEVKRVSAVLQSRIHFVAPYPIESLDLFVYQADGLKELQFHERISGGDAVLSLSDSLPKTLAVVANVRGTFNLDALNHFDSLDALVFRFSDDNPQAPLMTGIGSFVPGRDTTVALTPLLCTVQLTEVSNWMDGDRLAENPRVWLENINGQAEMFRERGFTVRDPVASKTERLPFDIGLYSQYPGTKLYCYPNDLPNPTTGNPATELVFQYEVDGKTRTQRYILHPIQRGSTIPVEVMIR